VKRRHMPWRGGELRRREPMARGPWRRPKRLLPVAVDQLGLLVARSLGWCEVSTPVCTPKAARVLRRRDGRRVPDDERDRLSDLLHVCARCAAWIGADRARAGALGLTLDPGQEPTAEMVWYRTEPVWLDDAGGVNPVDASAAS
jgi:hypothetical protein